MAGSIRGAADFDDGFTDLFVAGVNRNILYREPGDGTFEDVTERAGIKSDCWSVAAGWFDYDNDGRPTFHRELRQVVGASEPLCLEPAGNPRLPSSTGTTPFPMRSHRRDGSFENLGEERIATRERG